MAAFVGILRADGHHSQEGGEADVGALSVLLLRS